MAKLMYFDVETTGSKYWRHGIHQLSGAVEIDGVLKENFNFRVQPYHEALIDPKALAVSRTTEEQFKTFMPIEACYMEFLEILKRYINPYERLDKFFIVGFNNQGFDNNFLRMFFLHNKNDVFGSWFWSNSLDVMVLATQYLIERRMEMPSFKQHRVARTLGIPVDDSKLHDAVYDIHLLRQIYYKVIGKELVAEEPYTMDDLM